MFEQIRIGFIVVIPVFFLIALGALARRIDMMPVKSFRDLNRLVFYILLPSNLVYSIATADRDQLVNPTFGLMVLASLGVTFLLAMFLVPRLVKDASQRGVIVQALIRGNFVVLGFPILSRMYGPAGLAQVGFILLVSMPIYNITSIWALESLQGKRVSAGFILRRMLTNPMIIATLLGFGALYVPLPELVMATISLLAGASGTIALICLGGLLNLSRMGSNRMILGLISLIRLIIIPMIMLFIGYRIGLNEQSLMTLLVFFGAPVAVASFAMVQQSGGDEALAGQIILITTGLSLFSYAFWIGLIKYLFQA